MYFKCVTGFPSKLSRVVPGSCLDNCGIEGGCFESTGEQHDCAGFGALDLGHDGERIEDVVCQGNRYGFLLLTVAQVGSVRHLRSDAVVSGRL